MATGNSSVGSFPEQVAELERALEQAESQLRAPDLERTRALVAALMEVHRRAFQDLARLLGEEELARVAAAEPSVAWALACHEVSVEPLERSVAEAEEKAAARAARQAPAEAPLVPASRLVRREGERAP